MHIYQRLTLNNKISKQAEPKQRTFCQLPDGSGDEGMGEKGDGIEKHKSVVTE